MLLKLAEESVPATNTVVSNDNHVYFYSEVTPDKIVELMKCLRQVDIDLRTEEVTRDMLITKQIPIWLHINSNGGDVFSALSVADQIERLKTPVFAVIEGLCASAATFIALACHKRFITPRSFILAHEFNSFFLGKYSDFKDEVALQDMLFDEFVKFYVSKTSLSAEDLKERLKHNFWMSAEMALKYGFVDVIL